LLDLINKYKEVFTIIFIILLILIPLLFFIYQKFLYLVIDLQREINKKKGLDFIEILEDNKELFQEFKEDVNNLKEEFYKIKQTQKDIILQINLTNDSIRQIQKKAKEINQTIIDESNATFTKIDKRIKQIENGINNIYFSYEKNSSRFLEEIEQAKNDYFYIKELEIDNIKKQKYIDKLKKKLEQRN